MIDYCPDCGHRYTEGHFNRCPASGLTTESTDSVRCVICHVPCDASGLCDDHKYDDQPKPHVHKVIESMPWWARAFEQYTKGDDQ